MVRKPSLDENTELTLPLLSEEKVAVQSCTTYNTLVSTSSSSSSGGGSPKTSSVQGFFIPPRFQVHSGQGLYWDLLIGICKPIITLADFIRLKA